MAEPTRPMLREAAEAGLYTSTDRSTYPRLQILTIQQILEGKQPSYPIHRADATFKKAPAAAPQPLKTCCCLWRLNSFEKLSAAITLGTIRG